MKNITIVGIGYVGLSIAILLSKKNNSSEAIKHKIRYIGEKILKDTQKEIKNFLENAI